MRFLDSTHLRLELRRSGKSLALFAFLIAAGIVSAGIILKNQTFQKPWESYRTVRAEFDDVKGVVPGSQQVRIAGVPVGVVKDIDLDEGRAILTLSIRKKYGEIYRDATMRLRASTPLQDMYVALDRGSPRTGSLGSRILPAERTVTPVDISRVLNVFDTDTRKRLGVALDGLGAGMDDRGASLRATFAEAVPFLQMAKRATGVINRRQAATRRIVSNLSLLTGALARRNDAIAGLVENGERTLSQFALHDRNLAAAIGELPRTMSAMRSAFTSLRMAEDELDPALRSLDPVLTHLESGLRALTRFGVDARPALAALRGPVRTLNPLARDLQPTATALKDAMGRLAGQTRDFDVMTKLLPPCLKQIEGFFNNTNSFTKLADEGGVVPRAEATVSSDSFAPLAKAVPRDPSLKHGSTCTPGGQRP